MTCWLLPTALAKDVWLKLPDVTASLAMRHCSHRLSSARRRYSSASSTKIDSLEQQVTLLRELLSDQKATAAVLAQSQASVAQVAATPAPVVVVSPEPPKS